MKQLPFVTLIFAVVATACKKSDNQTSPQVIPTFYEVVSTTDGNGSIAAGSKSISFVGADSLKTTYTVEEGLDATFNVEPQSNYVLNTLTVDGKAIIPAVSFYTFPSVHANHTISATFAQYAALKINVTNGKASTIPAQVLPGQQITIIVTPNPTFHTDSLLINGAFVKSLAGVTAFAVNNVTANETITITCSDALTKTQLDSLTNLLVSSWHYVQYDYEYTGTTTWIIAPYLTDCEKGRYEVYTATHNYTYFLTGGSCDPTYAPTYIYFNGTWQFNASGKSILIAGNEYSNATTYQYVTGTFMVDKLTTDSLVIQYPVSGQNYSYRYHYVHK